MDEEEDRILISKLNRSFSKGRNPSVKLLGGEIVRYDRDNKEIHMRTFSFFDTIRKTTLRFSVETLFEYL